MWGTVFKHPRFHDGTAVRLDTDRVFVPDYIQDSHDQEVLREGARLLTKNSVYELGQEFRGETGVIVAGGIIAVRHFAELPPS